MTGNTKAALLTFVTELLAEDGSVLRVGPDDGLLSDGTLDSVNLVRLIQFVEERFSVAIPDEDIDTVLFASVSDLADYIDARR